MTADGMLTGLLVDSEGNAMPFLEEGYVEAMKECLKSPEFDCLGFNVIPVPNFLASEFMSEAFKMEGESKEDHKKRMSGWYNTWGKLLSTFVSKFNMKSADLFRTIFPQFWAIGDPTKFLTEIINMIKAELAPYINFDIIELLNSKLLLILSKMQNLVLAALNIFSGVRNLIN